MIRQWIRWNMFIGVILLSMGMVSHAQDDQLQVVASHSILGDVVAQVAGDAAAVSTVMPRGADPHSFVPSPGDMTAVADADVLFVNGAQFEEGLLDALENVGEDVSTVVASSCVPMIAFDGHAHDHDHGDEHDEAHDDDHDSEHDHEHDESHDDEHDESHDDEHDEAHDDEHSDESHDDEHHDSDLATLCESHFTELEDTHEDIDAVGYAHSESLGALYSIDCASEGDGGCDSHVWMAPRNVMYWTLRIRDALSEADPDNADIYAANADAYLTTLAALEQDTILPMIDTIPESDRLLVTNHEAFGYFAAQYGFEVVDTVIGSGSTTAEPGAGEIAEVIDRVREVGVRAIFSETSASDDLLQQVAAETDIGVYVLYSGSLSEDADPAGTYVDFMRYNVNTIVEALGRDSE